jgi:hypothetical protein
LSFDYWEKQNKDLEKSTSYKTKTLGKGYGIKCGVIWNLGNKLGANKSLLGTS